MSVTWGSFHLNTFVSSTHKTGVKLKMQMFIHEKLNISIMHLASHLIFIIFWCCEISTIHDLTENSIQTMSPFYYHLEKYYNYIFSTKQSMPTCTQKQTITSYNIRSKYATHIHHVFKNGLWGVLDLPYIIP